MSNSLLPDIFGSRTVGSCGKCHNIELADSVPIWKTPLDPLRKEFTYFSHAMHTSSKDIACSFCHQIKKGILEHSETGQPAGHSNFEPMDIEMCSSCHESSIAGESCLLCHNYHVGRFLPDAIDQFGISQPVRAKIHQTPPKATK